MAHSRGRVTSAHGESGNPVFFAQDFFASFNRCRPKKSLCIQGLAVKGSFTF